MQGCFNSITVQLRHDAPENKDVFLRGFNSITVQLRLSTVLCSKGIGRFQFHNGTIKTLNRMMFFKSIIVFQFHNGTIKTFFCCCRFFF